MGRYWLNVFLFRIIFPTVLVKSIIWRPCGLALLYLVLALVSPLIPVPTAENMKGATGYFLVSSVALTFLASFTQFAFHIVLLILSRTPHKDFLEFCELPEKILRHIGLVRLDDSSVWEIFYWLTPEVIVFPMVMILYMVIKKSTKVIQKDDMEDDLSLQQENVDKDRNSKIIDFIGKFGTYIVLAALCCVASLEPSVQGGFYFLVFILAATWWACNRELKRGFALVCRLLMFIVAINIVAILTYQTQWPQELVPVNSTWARYFALKPMFMTNCTDPREVLLNVDQERLALIPYIMSLFCLYYLLALQSKFLLQKPRPITVPQPPEPSERTPLMRFGTSRSGGLLQDSTGSVIVQESQQEDTIQMSSLENEAPEEKPGFVEHVIMTVFSVYQLLINSCYLAMNIIMMTWSIMYHSWTTFILLLWALILWMVPNKRKSMLKWSPFIVTYATLLLLVQYVYTMNLTDAELPPVIFGLKMKDFGFEKRDKLSFSHLLVKSLFLTTFWITMRQYMVEKLKQRRSSTMRDMVAPLHVSVSTATAAMQSQAERELKNKLMESIGAIVKTLFTKFWIVVVAVMLFTSGITGDHMTVFRIVYMSLFLLFIITFQVSWELWRKMMYVFWLAVIGYSVVMLILVYTYQFDDFPDNWETYLHISPELQRDIGLIKYETKDLFVRLFTPTFFVIISVLQIHYFHKDFLEVSDLKKVNVEKGPRGSLGNDPSDVQVVSPSDVFVSESTNDEPLFNFKGFTHMSKLEKLALMRLLKNYVHDIYNNTWLLLELHMQKIVFISFVILCINDVCAINFCFIVAVVVGINLNRFMQSLVIKTMSVAIAILMVAKMLYQIDYIDHHSWDVNCTMSSEGNSSSNSTISTKTYNIAEWLGLRKIDEHTDLSRLLKGYIWIIALTTLRSIILVRQWFYRSRKGLSLETPLLMFPQITRAEADRGMIPFFKFMLNYGFYKFGLEICLIAMVVLIGTRLDFSSVVYSLWLMALYGLKRRHASRVWPVLKIFGIVLVPLQYACVVALPPWLCFDYPWTHTPKEISFQEWMFLPNPDSKPNAQKLLYDFILLMIIVRQSLVFNIEHRSMLTGREFIAGHNYSVYKLMDSPNFVNPVKDFVSEIHSYLDVLKRGVMMSLMWVTLSIMFMAGTKRTNLFSLGYLIGAFVFLWQGNDFYLLPVRNILKRWNTLIGYNIIVIFCKSIFQGIGCIYIDGLVQHTCWLVQLLGIACLNKFEESDSQFKSKSSQCVMDREDIGMFWDGLCFAFLILQKRLFRSFYFFHIVDETKAMSILASRGAELLEELHQKRIIEQENHEKAILQKIKAQMDKIKATQRKIQGPVQSDYKSHNVDTLYNPRERPMYARYTPQTHKEAIRSGDYYMFDDMEDDDLATDVYMEKEPSEEERESPLDREYQPRTMTVGELMQAWISTDIEIATHVALYGGTQKDALKLRRRSVPLTRKKSSRKSTRSDTGPGSSQKPTVDGTKGDDDKGGGPPKDEPDDEIDEDPDSKVESEPRISIITYFKFMWAFINSIMVSLTKYLNHFSRDYRYIRKVLSKEKKLLKAKPDFRKGTRLGISQMWQPLAMVKQRSREDENQAEPKSDDAGEGTSSKEKDVISLRKEDTQSVPYIRILAPSLERGLDLSSSSSEVDHEEEEAQLSEVDQPPIIQLAASIWIGILAHSTFLCYFMVFLHQIKNASVLSTPLPLMVFFWGSLTIPRPTKTFWITMIAYIEVIVLIKCICQPAFLTWNEKSEVSSNPFELSRILGVEKKPNYALWDLLLLLVVFFHRFMLKSLGQWTAPQVKSRKVIPSYPTLAVLKKPEDVERNIETELEQATALEPPLINKNEIIVKTPEGRVLSLQTPENTEIQECLERGDYERLVVISGSERSLLEENFGKAMHLTLARYFKPMTDFFKSILDSTGKERTNVYAYMFLCDFFNFLLLIFGFSAFSAPQVDDGGVTAYFQENRVPMQFLLMLLFQFALIVIDRALFLKKSILGKLIFQYCLIVGVHLWMFLGLPSATERQFNAKLGPQIWYVVKCFYLLLAAYQLRQGYPTRILGNFLCKKFSVINYVLFKGFMTVPFLFEMRAVMDWIWTDTSMTIMDWFKMEDIYATIYQIKCMRGLESDYPQPRGIKKAQSGKNLVGGGALLLMIGIIWFPLLLFAVGSTVGESNLPHEVTLSLKIGSYEPIYTIAGQNSSIFPYSEKHYEDLRKLYEVKYRDRPAVMFLENYIHSDIAAVKLSTESSKLWGISPPDKERLKNELNSTNDMIIHVEWTIYRKPAAKELPPSVTHPWDIPVPAFVDGKRNPVRDELLEALDGTTEYNRMDPTADDSRSVTLKRALPTFLKVTGRGTAPVPQLAKPLVQVSYKNASFYDDQNNYNYRDITLVVTNTSFNQQYFGIRENCTDTIFNSTFSEIPLNDCSKIMLFLFNDKKFPEGLSFISGLGIFGLYTTAVIIVGSFIKKMVSDQVPKIMFEDLPYVDRILRLCLNIYLVRESGDLYLEEDLFAKLIFLFRSPETLIRWSRPPEPNDEDESSNENYDEIDGDDDDNDDGASSVRFRKERNFLN